MKIFKKKSQCRQEVEKLRMAGQTIGLVPTMGYLHQGHLSLAQIAKNQCQKVFMTIFVNPKQFWPDEDLDKYPRNLKRDASLARSIGVDYIFNPEAEEIYGEDHRTFIEVNGLSKIMCGEHRPGHFGGVAVIVLKLFNIIPADRAYFGSKDFQQLVIIKKMVEDLDIDMEIVECPIIREEDGLAMSSRNKYLDPEERKNAPVIYRVLKHAEKSICSGETDAGIIRRMALKELGDNRYIKRIDYFDIRDARTLEELDKVGPGRKILLATAAVIGNTRLIDNVVINKKK